MNIQILNCTADHVTALQTIGRNTFYETFNKQNTEQNMSNYLATAFDQKKLLTELSNPHSSFYLLYVNEKLAGYLKVNTADAQTDNVGNEALEVERIYVLNAFQKKGLGKVLMDKALQLAKAQQKNKVWLGVWEKNLNAIAFYEKLGFVKSGYHSFMMGDEEQRDYIMVKTL